MSDVIFDTNLIYDDNMTQEKYDALPKEKQAEYSRVTKDGQTRFARSSNKPADDIPNPNQASVNKNVGGLNTTKEEEKKDREKYNDAATKEDFYFGNEEFGTDRASKNIGKSKAGQDVYGVTGLDSKGEILKAKYQKDKNREDIKEQVDADKQKRLALDEIENKLKIKSITRDGEKIYQVGDKVFASKLDAEDYINTEKEKIEEQRKEIGQDETKIAGKNVYKSKSEEIDDALKYRGIGYLNWIRKKGIINDKEYKKYRDQIQEVRDIRKPGIAKALNTAYLIYNAIANGFRNMGNLAFNVAGKGQVQYSQSALGNMLENAFEKAQEVNVAREKGAIENVFDWQKAKQGLVLDSAKAFRDWGIKARENWSDFDRQTATNVISSYLLKDQKAYDELIRRRGYAWDKLFAEKFGKYMEGKTDKEKREFITGLFLQAGDSPDGLMKMLTAAFTSLPRESAMKYFFENDYVTDNIDGVILSDDELYRKVEAELKKAGYEGVELAQETDKFIQKWKEVKKKKEKNNREQKGDDKKSKKENNQEENLPPRLNPANMTEKQKQETEDIKQKAQEDLNKIKESGSIRQGE